MIGLGARLIGPYNHRHVNEQTPATVTPGTVLSFGTLLLAQQRGNGD